MKDLNTILEKIERAKALDFGTIFSQSIELFKKTWVPGLVIMLLTMVLMVPLYLVMYLPMLAMGLANPEYFASGNDFNPLLLIPFVLLILVFVFFASIIGFGLKSAFYRICKTKDFNQATSDDYFYFFKKPYLGKTIKLALATFGISIIAALLCFVPVIYVIVPITLMNVVYAFNPDMTVSDIIKIAFKLGNKKWLLAFGLMIVAGALAGIVGMLMCFIGIYVTTSFVYLPFYFIYKESIGFNETHVIDEIGISTE